MNQKDRATNLWRWRERLVGELTGDVLEIGVGEGANLRYYRQAHQVWGIEPDPTRAQRAREAAVACAIPMTIEVTGAETLPYPAATFDHVVSSLVFCSVNDQVQVLREIRRVLKPDGTLHMVEHVRPQTRWVATLFAAITPRWRRIAHNCHLDRPTLEVLQREGWQVQLHRRIGMFVRVSATA